MSELNVGIVGCGNISTAYLQLAPMFAGFRIKACADINSDAATAQAAEFDCKSLSVEALMEDTSGDQSYCAGSTLRCVSQRFTCR